MVGSRLLLTTSFLLAILLAGCATTPVPVQTIDIDKPNWPAVTPDDVNVRPSLKKLVQDHPALKVVLRVPTANVTQSQNSGNLDSVYDEIEKVLFNAGFTVRDRALLSSLIDKESIGSYKDIQSRVDTDLIIEISSLQFNDKGEQLITRSYFGADGAQSDIPGNFFTMGQTVASIEAKFVIVATGEVGGIVTLRVPFCSVNICKFRYMLDSVGNTTITSWAVAKHVTVYDSDTHTTIYDWDTGTGPATTEQATDQLAHKIVTVLKQ